MTLRHSLPPKTKLEYKLHPNYYRQHLLSFWWYTGAMALPVLLAHLGLWKLFQLPYAIHFSLIGLLAVILTLSIRYFLGNHADPLLTSLLISDQKIHIKQQNKKVQKVNKADLQLEMISWGPCEEELLPAVRIRYGGKSLMTIGALQNGNGDQRIRHSVQATDLVLPADENWQAFLKALKQNG